MKKIVRFLLFALFSFVAGSILGAITLSVLYAFDIKDPEYPAMEQFVPMVLTFGFWIIVMMAFCRKMKWKRPSYKIKIGKINFPLILLALVMVNLLHFVFDPLLSLIPDVMMDDLESSVTGGFWSMLTVVVAAPILEEFLFRGIFQQNFSKFLGRVWGVLLSAFIFGVIHIIPQQAAGAVLGGLVLCMVYELTGSLSTAVILHILNNGIAYMLIMTFGIESSLMDVVGVTDENYWEVYGVTTILVLGIGYLAFRRLTKMDCPTVERVELVEEEEQSELK